MKNKILGTGGLAILALNNWIAKMVFGGCMSANIKCVTYGNWLSWGLAITGIGLALISIWMD